MFSANTSISMCLIALSLGTFLLMWTCANKEKICCTLLPKIVAYLVMVVAILSLVCSVYHKISYYKSGYGMNKGSMRGMMDMGYRGRMYNKDKGPRDCECPNSN